MPAIYLDNAASTRVSDEVLALVTEVMRTSWGNPSSQHPQGAAARGHLEAARLRLLAALGDPRGTGDILWTSGCSEANAVAVLGAARTHAGAIVISTLEHAAISTLADRLAVEGREVRRVGPGRDGVLDPEAIAAACDGAGVVSIIAVQNELGVVQPIAAIVAAVRTRAPNAHIHIDAAQALGKIALDATTLGADSISLAGHKLHAPKGVGALWLRRSAKIEPLWVGGGQQHGLRGGTQDAPNAAGLGLAAERAVAALPKQRTRWLELAAMLVAELERRGVAIRQLVPDHRRAPHILALAVASTPASALRNVLSSRGVYVSTGSACADGDSKPTPALEAIGLPQADGMVRLSFGHDTTLDEVMQAATILADVIASLSSRTPG
ncbi:MAG TPA: aminotransferase class V-fold PLP-dependent enzyme [Kofleriaceae bacterium]